MPPPLLPSSLPPPRRGSIYVPTLIIGSILLAISLGALALTRASTATTYLQRDTQLARDNARSALEIARSLLTADNAWRTTHSNGTWISDLPLPTGTLSLSVTNPAGPLDRSPLDPVYVTATGTSGSATQSLTATFSPSPPSPINSLSSALFAAGPITFSTNANVSGTSLTIASNSSVTSLSTSTISPHIKARSGIVGTGFTGSLSIFYTPLQTASSDTLSLHALLATPIPYTSLPTSGTGRTLELQLLSPNQNPHGTPSPTGIYLIDCAGGPLTLRNARLVTTLIILNASSVTLSDSLNWTPPDPSLPILLTDSPLLVDLSASDLTESASTGSLNPPGTPHPYPTGPSNSDTADAYPSRLDGLIFSTASVTLQGNTTLHSLHTLSSLSISQNLTLTYTPRHTDTPPRGFYTAPLRLLPESFR